MNIPELVSTRERYALLSELLYSQNGAIGIRDLARRAGTSPAQAHKYVTILENNGLVKNRRLEDTAAVRSIRELLNLKKLEEAKITGIIRKTMPGTTGIGVFGSWATGTNTPDSDLDLWVKAPAPAPEAQTAAAKNTIEKRLKTKVDLLTVSPEMQSGLRLKGEAFYYSLYHGKVLWGEGF